MANPNILRTGPPLTRRDVITKVPVLALGFTAALQGIFNPESAAAAPQSPRENIQRIEFAVGDYPILIYSGIPNEVQKSSLPYIANTPDKAGLVHNNTIGFGEDVVADPGTFTNEGFYRNASGQIDLDGINRAQADIANGAAYNLLNPDHHRVFDSEPYLFPIQRMEFGVISADGRTFTFPGPNGNIVLNAEKRRGHVWMFVIHNNKDTGILDDDPSFDVVATNIHKGSVTGFKCPPGLTYSENNLKQNAVSAHGKNCGLTGCSKLTVVIVDAPHGTFSLAHQGSVNGPWEDKTTNLK